MKMMKQKKEERSSAFHWSNGMAVLGFFALIMAVALVVLWPPATKGSMSCSVTGIEWKMMQEGQECWLYEASTKHSSWETKPGTGNSGFIWQMKWDETKHCPLPTNIECEGDFDARIPITAFFEVLRNG